MVTPFLGKCKYVIFHTSQKQHLIPIIKLNNTIKTELMNSIINKNLNSDSHKMAEYFLPINDKVLIYSWLILSHLNLCNFALGYRCDGIVKLQRKPHKLFILLI